MILPHTHTCVRCTFTWDCLLQARPTATVCEVVKAAKANKDGPYCLCCRHLEMALRAAELRGWTFECVWTALQEGQNPGGGASGSTSEGPTAPPGGPGGGLAGSTDTAASPASSANRSNN